MSIETEKDHNGSVPDRWNEQGHKPSCRTFKIDDQYGVPDKMIREYLAICEARMGLIRVSIAQVVSKTATLLTVIVTKADDYEGT